VNTGPNARIGKVVQVCLRTVARGRSGGAIAVPAAADYEVNIVWRLIIEITDLEEGDPEYPPCNYSP
jgi:hypothetical protein